MFLLCRAILLTAVWVDICHGRWNASVSSNSSTTASHSSPDNSVFINAHSNDSPESRISMRTVMISGNDTSHQATPTGTDQFQGLLGHTMSEIDLSASGTELPRPSESNSALNTSSTSRPTASYSRNETTQTLTFNYTGVSNASFNDILNTSLRYSSTTRLSDLSKCSVTSYPIDFPITTRTFQDPCSFGQARVDVSSIYVSYADTCLATWCSTSYVSAQFAWAGNSYNQEHWPVTTEVRTTMDLDLLVNTSIPFEEPGYYYYTHGPLVTTTYIGGKELEDIVKPSAPCCGNCEMSLEQMGLFFWPDLATSPTPQPPGGAPQSFVDEVGFTFISPSVYLGITSLGATNRCGRLGPFITSTTIAFNPEEISTIYSTLLTTVCVLTDRLFHKPATFRVIGDKPTRPMTYSDLLQACSWRAYPGLETSFDFPLNWAMAAYGDNPCFPLIAIPSKIRDLEPAWRTCTAYRELNYGAGWLDPPRTLHPGVALVPTVSASTTVSDPAMTATPPPSLPQIPGPTTALEEPVTTSTSAVGPKLPSQSTRGRDPSEPTRTTSVPLITVTLIPDGPSVIIVPPVSIRPDPVDPGKPADPASSQRPPAPGISRPVIPPDSSGPGKPAVPASSQRSPAPGISRPIIPQDSSDPGNPASPASSKGAPAPIISSSVVPQGSSDPGKPADPASSQRAPAPIVSGPVVPQGSSELSRGIVQVGNGPTSAPPLLLPFGSTTLVADASSRFTISGQTLTPGGTITIGATTVTLTNRQTTLIGGTRLGLDPAGTAVVLGGTSTIAILRAEPTNPPEPEIVIKVYNQLLTLYDDGSMVSGGRTIGSGSSIVVGGITLPLLDGRVTAIGARTISFDPVAAKLVMDGTSTIDLSNVIPTAMPNQVAVFTIGGHLLTVLANGQMVDGSKTVQSGSFDVIGGVTSTLSNGQVTVKGGTTISLAPNATGIVVNGFTSPLSGSAGQSTSVQVFAEKTDARKESTAGSIPSATIAGSPLPSKTVELGYVHIAQLLLQAGANPDHQFNRPPLTERTKFCELRLLQFYRELYEKLDEMDLS
ncbi:hypothetical protein BDV96DRAFT_601338 [Lophiotrema nucula]|uniref:Uncharacterized protein n=1 Tax=Lophiotrema nucula TaxID=690887 RepID=A0A6A5Z461_9PLEO|nr:hypothetical protein BDV96DRAFT_601338 [Lophiotrema nucula]